MSIRPLNFGWLLVMLLLGPVLGQAQIRRVNGNVPGQANALTVVWNPSPSPGVVGYALYWGVSSDSCTNRIAVRNVTNVTLVGLRQRATYHFAVAAYDATGEESPWSNLIQYSRAPRLIAPTVTTNLLQLQHMQLAGTNPVMRLSFTGQAEESYRLEVTEDFQRWDVLCVTNCAKQQLVVYDLPYVPSAPHRFFRLLEE